jgi:4-amino-4-deoxy-L-arabinose transferase-like glycosyltransferase
MKIALKEAHVNVILLILAIFFTSIHIIASYNLGYHRDELLYFSLGMHPSFGYATVPPLIGWIAWLMQNLFGYSIFAVRLFPAVAGGVMVFLVSAIAKELGGSTYARILAAIGLMISIVALRTFLFFMPVHIDLIFWTLIFYLVIKYINTSSGKYLVLLGLATGFALLNKYLIALLIILFLIIIPFTKYRFIFRLRSFWYGIIGSFIVFLPNIIWQIVNGLPVIAHMAELKRTQLVNVSEVSFLIEQIMIPGAASFLTIAGIIYLFTEREVRKYRFVGIVILSVILVLMLLHGKSYYTQGIFPFLIAAGAVSWERTLRRTIPRLILVLVLIIMTIPFIPTGIPVYKQERLVKYFTHIKKDYGMDFVTRFEDNSIHSLPQDYADMLGWEELAEIVNIAWQKISDKQAAFIYCENYGQAGAVTVIGRKYGLPEAVSFSESFKYWIPRDFSVEPKSLVYVNYELGDDVRSLFKDITLIGSISNPDAREYGTKVFLCKEPVGNMSEFWKERIKEIR